ncbi:rhamnogalacturonan lyase [Brevundimonas sp. SH203]|uniref:rhamnogalacturonan lyase n=1 Tax=Brevundimonas sp. SH203 TaxID=345167 RepID=UPI0013566A93|nr:rhamnogalacturonan lyase [Brevundimonas sp. SH203]
MIRLGGLTVLTGAGFALAPALAHAEAPRLESLDRSVIATAAPDNGVLVQWRLLATDPANARFDVFRNGVRAARIGAGQATNWRDASGDLQARYAVRRVGEQTRSEALNLTDGYLTIPLDRPEGGVTPDGVAYEYEANDGTVGDLDGDGRYEIVLKWQPTNAKDNAFAGFTGPTLIDAYTLDGRRLWRIDLGRNIRSGAHYTQMVVQDFDGDGRAEVVLKTADGTIDGADQMIGDAEGDWREDGGEIPSRDRTGAEQKPDGTLTVGLKGRILSGPEFITVFDGRTGAALATAPYVPSRGRSGDEATSEEMAALWGDGYGNRSERYLAGAAYLDGRLPSIVMARGYYGRTVVAAWDWRDGRLSQRWVFDKAPDGYAGQGNHQFSVADVDGDGRQEIVYGAMALDDDGTPLWTTRLGHGDAMHVGDLDPTRPGLEKFGVHENVAGNGGVGSAMVDARTGEILWRTPGQHDVGRGVALDIDPRYPGAEVWASNSNDLYSADGRVIGHTRPQQMNFGVWWDGDVLRELLDGTRIFKWDWENQRSVPLLSAEGAASNNGTKANPVLVADILGDWREEVVWRTADSSALRIYVTLHPTAIRHVTLMHDAQYRSQVSGQNSAYNQPSHPSFAFDAATPAERGR